MFTTPDSARLWMSRLRNGPVAIAAVSTLLYRIVNVVLGIVTTILVARHLGASGYGEYAIGFTVSTIFAGLAQLAYSHHIVNRTSKYLANKNWDLLNGLRNYTAIIAFALVGISSIVLFIALSISVNQGYSFAAVAGAVTAPFIIASIFASAFLRGLGKFSKAHLPQYVISQVYQLTLIITFLSTGTLSVETALISYGVAWLITAIISWIIVVRAWPENAQGVRGNILAKQWSGSTFYIFVGGLSGVLIGRIEVFALLEFGSADDIGVYALAFRFAQFVTFPVFALSSGLAPEVSRLFAIREFGLAQGKILSATRIATPFSVFISVFLFLISANFFPAINDEFRAAAPILLILCLGYVVQAAFGFPIIQIVAFGLERKFAIPGIVGAAIGLIMVGMLAATFGVPGAAIATALTVSLTALIRWAIVVRNMKFRCDIFSKRRANFRGVYS